MANNASIYKIYSRKRLGLNKRVLSVIVCVIIIFFIYCVIYNFVSPIFIDICEDEAKSIATKITNEETSKIMQKYDYDTFFTIEKDADDNIQMISANILEINQITSDVALEIQNSLDSEENNKIYISLGSITGIDFLVGSGPKVEIEISTIGNVETTVKSEFIAQGVNQTLHRVYMEVQTNVGILLPNSTIEESIYNQILILENVIIGEIPSSYYDFDGIDESSEALEIVE